MEVANTLAYFNTAKITSIKGFIVQAPGLKPQENSNLWWVFKKAIFLGKEKFFDFKLWNGVALFSFSHPGTNQFVWGAFSWVNRFYFFNKTTYLNEEVHYLSASTLSLKLFMEWFVEKGSSYGGLAALWNFLHP
jgi:hypothetical protein